jgi:hypothetical protein
MFGILGPSWKSAASSQPGNDLLSSLVIPSMPVNASSVVGWLKRMAANLEKEGLCVIWQSTGCRFKVSFRSSSTQGRAGLGDGRESFSALAESCPESSSQWYCGRSRFLAGHGSLFEPLSEAQLLLP